MQLKIQAYPVKKISCEKGKKKVLKLKNIKKSYPTGGQTVEALKGVTLAFRKSEFVSVLGPSGCGKTTLLNIIGGLDRYSEGDLIIKGKSTKTYSSREWDAYRNHSVGFVFQNYNLIPHQSVLANVEIALTLSGVKKKERRRRAEEALKKVGLGDQMQKRPNQMSGGQMQRVAIARAIVNDPEILLADEPTGALDSETSLQVMEILKEIAKDRLVIMVTHNPELAERYSTRIIRLMDGKIIGDTMPYSEEEEEAEEKNYRLKKNKSMSFFTALGLSLNNLMTKKGRTVMTCFAGSIGIIGIALILAVSHGVNLFIDKVQEDTLARYPLTIEAETVDLSAVMESMGAAAAEGQTPHELDKVYAGDAMYRMVEMMTSVTTSKNNITDFKKYIENSEEFLKYTSAIRYSYPVLMNIYLKNEEGTIVKVDSEKVLTDMYAAMGITVGGGSASGSMIQSYATALNVWEELLAGEDGELINPMLREQYDVIYGEWPKDSHEVVLVLNERNEVSDFVLYALGLKSSSELADLMKAAMEGKELPHDEKSWSYEEICDMSFRLILAPDEWQKQADGSYRDLTQTETGLNYLFGDPEKYTELKISGIVRPNENALFSMITGSLGYTSALTEEIIEKTNESEPVKAQMASPDTDVFTGLPFAGAVKEPEKEEKVQAVKDYFASLDNEGKAALYTEIAATPTEEYVSGALAEAMKDMTREQMTETIVAAYAQEMGTTDVEAIKSYIDAMEEEELTTLFAGMARETIEAQYRENVKQQLAALPVEQLAAMLDALPMTEEEAVSYYSLYLPKQVSEADYETNMGLLGYVDPESPSQITIYASSFNDKNKISDLIEEYNRSVEEEDQIKMTDYIKLLMSSVSTVINAISYVLIAFVAISLVVSSIMIGVITNISVLERTKEIGILRAVGASKGDIARVFNAETFMIGLLSGLIGIGVTLFLILPINLILHFYTEIAYLNANLPVTGAVILVLLSMFLTIIAGLIPARSASKKDPVVALRSE